MEIKKTPPLFDPKSQDSLKPSKKESKAASSHSDKPQAVASSILDRPPSNKGWSVPHVKLPQQAFSRPAVIGNTDAQGRSYKYYPASHTLMIQDKEKIISLDLSSIPSTYTCALFVPDKGIYVGFKNGEVHKWDEHGVKYKRSLETSSRSDWPVKSISMEKNGLTISWNTLAHSNSLVHHSLVIPSSDNSD